MRSCGPLCVSWAEVVDEERKQLQGGVGRAGGALAFAVAVVHRVSMKPGSHPDSAVGNGSLWTAGVKQTRHLGSQIVHGLDKEQRVQKDLNQIGQEINSESTEWWTAALFKVARPPPPLPLHSCARPNMKIV